MALSVHGCSAILPKRQALGLRRRDALQDLRFHSALGNRQCQAQVEYMCGTRNRCLWLDVPLAVCLALAGSFLFPPKLVACVFFSVRLVVAGSLEPAHWRVRVTKNFGLHGNAGAFLQCTAAPVVEVIGDFMATGTALVVVTQNKSQSIGSIG